MKVKVIGLENGKISLSAKQLKEDPWEALPKKYKIGDVFEWEVIRFVPYGVFVRVFDDINWLVHLSELSQKAVNNPNEVVRIGQKVKVKLIVMDPRTRKIGLSMKDLDENKEEKEVEKKSTKKSDLADIADKLEKEEAEKKATRKPRAKKTESEEE